MFTYHTLQKLLNEIIEVPMAQKGLAPHIFTSWPQIMGKWAQHTTPLRIFKDKTREGNCLLIQTAPSIVAFLQTITEDIVRQCKLHIPQTNIVSIKFVNKLG